MTPDSHMTPLHLLKVWGGLAAMVAAVFGLGVFWSQQRGVVAQVPEIKHEVSAVKDTVATLRSDVSEGTLLTERLVCELLDKRPASQCEEWYRQAHSRVVRRERERQEDAAAE